MLSKGIAVGVALLGIAVSAFAGKDPYTLDLRSENLPNIVSIYGAMNDMCRDSPDAEQACARRESAAAEMERRGWCWGPLSAIESDKEWIKCSAEKPPTSLPRFDVKAHCGSVASSAGLPSEVIFGGCMNQEQSLYNELKKSWVSVPKGIKDHCIYVSTAWGEGSYTILNGCIQQESQAKKTNAGTQFRY